MLILSSGPAGVTGLRGARTHSPSLSREAAFHGWPWVLLTALRAHQQPSPSSQKWNPPPEWLVLPIRSHSNTLSPPNPCHKYPSSPSCPAALHYTARAVPQTPASAEEGRAGVCPSLLLFIRSRPLPPAPPVCVWTGRILQLSPFLFIIDFSKISTAAGGGGWGGGQWWRRGLCVSYVGSVSSWNQRAEQDVGWSAAAEPQGRQDPGERERKGEGEG